MAATPLRVAFDAHNLSLPEGTGIATYTRNLESALLDMGCETHAVYGLATSRHKALDPEVAFCDAFRAASPRPLIRSARNWLAMAQLGPRACRARVVPQGTVDRRHLAHRLPRVATVHNAQRLYDVATTRLRLTGGLQRLILETPVDVWHTTCPLPVTMPGTAQVCTIHDLIPLTLPFTTSERKAEYGLLLRRIAQRFDMLFAVSQSSRDAVVSLLDVPPERVTVTYQSVSIDPEIRDTTPDALASTVKAICGLESGRYLLFVGAIEPKKNLPRLIEAHLGSGVGLPLVVLGPDGWLVDGETRLMNEAVRQGHVVRLPYASRGMVLQLMKGARALVSPSLSEGFGLPALEALQLGCPVIASSAGALPEVCGEAALFVDPYDVGSIARALRTAVDDDPLCERLAREGLEQSRRFQPSAVRERLERGYAAAIENSAKSASGRRARPSPSRPA